MTPRSNSSSSFSGRRNSATTRWIQLSGLPRIIHLGEPTLHTYLAIIADVTQKLTQAIAGSHHSHLQGGYAHPGQLRHLLVSQLFDVLQQERFTLLGPQTTQRPLDLFAPGTTLGRMLLSRLVQGQIVADERPRPTSATCTNSAAAIYQNAKQPCAEPLGIFAPSE